MDTQRLIKIVRESLHAIEALESRVKELEEEVKRLKSPPRRPLSYGTDY